MVTSTQTAPCNKLVTRDDVLRLIPQHYLLGFFKRAYLKRELIIGLVGLRGDGKSGSGAVIALVEEMLAGRPVWSNMAIGCELGVDDSLAQSYGMKRGGIVKYSSVPLDKEGILRLDPQYHDGCIFTDEVNMEFSEGRRAMSNTNLLTNAVAQQIRKYTNDWIYTVIDEMFIDNHLRGLTDIFIKCEDTAISLAGFAAHKQVGIDFKWVIYAMSRYLTGESYHVTHRPLPPVYLHFAPWRGIYNDKQAQGIGRVKYGIPLSKGKGEMAVGVETKRSPELQYQVDQWGWLEAVANDLYADGRKVVRLAEVMRREDVKQHQIDKITLSAKLHAYFGIGNRTYYDRGARYSGLIIPDEAQRLGAEWEATAALTPT